jgi:hypothetical protein
MSSPASPGTAPKSNGSPSPAPWAEASAGSRAPAPEGFPVFIAHLQEYFDTNHDRRITVAETFTGLTRLGLPAWIAGPTAAVIHFGMIGIGLARGRLLDPLALPLPLAGPVRYPSDTRIIDANGHYDPRRVAEIFEKYGQGDTITAAGLGRLVAADVAWSASRGSLLRRLVAVPFGASASVGELGLLYLVASRKEGGRRVLAKETLYRFYNDPMFFQAVADRVAAERAAKGETFAGRVENVLRAWFA